MGKTSIEWATDVWNPVTGCTKVSEGCRNCYAELIMERFYGKGSFGNIKLHYDRLDIPRRWRKPRRIFVNSMSDLFHEQVPREFLKAVNGVFMDCPQHIFMVLTKRPKRMMEYFNDDPPPPNVWVGVSVEDQKTADERIPILLNTSSAIRWVSAEPLLGPIDLQKHYWTATYLNWLDWVVVGGESGPHKRPMDLASARSIRDQCKEAGVPFFMKQINKIQPIPEDLMIREYPKF